MRSVEIRRISVGDPSRRVLSKKLNLSRCPSPHGVSLITKGIADLSLILKELGSWTLDLLELHKQYHIDIACVTNNIQLRCRVQEKISQIRRVTLATLLHSARK